MKDNDILEVEQYKERLNIALKAAKICVFEVDLKNQQYTFFENAEDIFGVSGQKILEDVLPYSRLSPEDYQAKVSEYFSHPDDASVIDEAFKCILDGNSTTYQARMKAGGSDYVWCKIDVTAVIEKNKPVKMIGVITDITEIKTRTDILESAIRLDTFTCLYNKQYSIDFIQKMMQAKTAQNHALLLVDIDNFKMINDTYGHDSGDNIIRLVADTLKKSFRKTDMIGRFGGDEFILFIQNIPSMEWLIHRVEALVRCENGGFSCTNSIGISIFPKDATEFDPLFKKADQALYQSKIVKERYTFFTSEMKP